MDSPVKYIFGTLAVLMFFAAVITFLERITGQDEMSYATPFFLLFLGSGLGILAWAFNPTGANEDSDNESTDEDSEASAVRAAPGPEDD